MAHTNLSAASNVETTADLKAGYSGVHVRLKPVKTESGTRFEAEIRSGYRAGNVLCHAQTDAPVRWPSASEARNWLVETGYTVIPQEGMVDSAMTNSSSNDSRSQARERYASEMQKRVARAGIPVPAGVVKAFNESRDTFIQSLLTAGQGITKSDIAFMESTGRAKVAAFYWDACDDDARKALLNDESVHVRGIAAGVAKGDSQDIGM